MPQSWGLFLCPSPRILPQSLPRLPILGLLNGDGMTGQEALVHSLKDQQVIQRTPRARLPDYFVVDEKLVKLFQHVSMRLLARKLCLFATDEISLVIKVRHLENIVLVQVKRIFAKELDLLVIAHDVDVHIPLRHWFLTNVESGGETSAARVFVMKRGAADFLSGLGI